MSSKRDQVLNALKDVSQKAKDNTFNLAVAYGNQQEALKKVVRELAEELKSKKKELDEQKAKESARNQAEEDCNKDIEVARADIANAQTKISELQKPIEGLSKQCETIRAQITSEVNKELNKLFEVDTPKGLTPAAEAFTANLRGAKNASSVDVELYFKDFSKLNVKMQKIAMNPEKYILRGEHQMDFVAANSKTMEDMIGGIKSDAAIAKYATYIEWGIVFGKLCQQVLRVGEQKKKVEDDQVKIAELEMSLDTIQKVRAAVKEVGLIKHYESQVADAKQRMDQATHLQEEFYQHMLQGQQSFHNFENTFFKSFVQEATKLRSEQEAEVKREQNDGARKSRFSIFM